MRAVTEARETQLDIASGVDPRRVSDLPCAAVLLAAQLGLVGLTAGLESP
jgi:hypothetical protein